MPLDLPKWLRSGPNTAVTVTVTTV